LSLSKFHLLGRLYYDGCACAAVNGSLVAQGSQFSLRDIEVVTATVDLDSVQSYRGVLSSLREQASAAERLPVIRVRHRMCLHWAMGEAAYADVSAPIEPR
jgi:NAD+ synthase (glutamine-hydrolysing)